MFLYHLASIQAAQWRHRGVRGSARGKISITPPPPSLSLSLSIPSLFFLTWQRSNRSTIQGFHLYSDKGYLSNLAPGRYRITERFMRRKLNVASSDSEEREAERCMGLHTGTIWWKLLCVCMQGGVRVCCVNVCVSAFPIQTQGNVKPAVPL